MPSARPGAGLRAVHKPPSLPAPPGGGRGDGAETMRAQGVASCLGRASQNRSWEGARGQVVRAEPLTPEEDSMSLIGAAAWGPGAQGPLNKEGDRWALNAHQMQ